MVMMVIVVMVMVIVMMVVKVVSDVQVCEGPVVARARQLCERNQTMYIFAKSLESHGCVCASALDRR